MNTFYYADIAGELRDSIRKHEAPLLDLCRYIWANPELGLKEVRACEVQTRFLREAGFQVTTPFAGQDTLLLPILYPRSLAGIPEAFQLLLFAHRVHTLPEAVVIVCF